MKGEFIGHTDVRILDKPGKFMLVTCLKYRAADGRMYIVPAGFVTDLASIPRLMRWLFNVNGRSRLPAILHDWLYRSGIYSRAEADALFKEACLAAGVWWGERYSLWLGVRIGGWAFYRPSGD